jgi:hypothetical protein
VLSLHISHRCFDVGMVIPSALCLAIAASSIAATPRDTSKVVIISWDVAPNWVIREMVDAGKLPGLARIAAAGFRSDGMQPAYPSKTAVGHASIFMGTWPDIHGVSNNQSRSSEECPDGITYPGCKEHRLKEAGMWPHGAELKVFSGSGWCLAIPIGGDIVQQSAASKAGKFIPHIGDFSGSPKVRNHEIALFAEECDLGGWDHNAHCLEVAIGWLKITSVPRRRWIFVCELACQTFLSSPISTYPLITISCEA